MQVKVKALLVWLASPLVSCPQSDSIEHLGSKLVVVLGHTGCGAVGAALKQNSGYVKHITDEIKRAIGTESDTEKASILNVMQSVSKINEHLTKVDGLLITGALYHTESGIVDFLE